MSRAPKNWSGKFIQLLQSGWPCFRYLTTMKSKCDKLNLHIRSKLFSSPLPEKWSELFEVRIQQNIYAVNNVSIQVQIQPLLAKRHLICLRWTHEHQALHKCVSSHSPEKYTIYRITRNELAIIRYRKRINKEPARAILFLLWNTETNWFWEKEIVISDISCAVQTITCFYKSDGAVCTPRFSSLFELTDSKCGQICQNGDVFLIQVCFFLRRIFSMLLPCWSIPLTQCTSIWRWSRSHTF